MLTIPCPTCRQETSWGSNNYRPFCSERCKLLDFGSWAHEQYRVPSSEDPPALIKLKQEGTEDPP